MKRWIRGGIGAAALTLVLQPGNALACGAFVQRQEVNIETELQKVTEVRSEPEENRNGWEEEYTDTDSRRGTFSVRCEAFRGFYGTIELQIRNRVGEWERSLILEKGGGYAVNLPLPVGGYEIDEIKAETDGREFGCQADRKEIEVEEGKIAMCRITITPDSVYHLPYEESTMGEAQDKTAPHAAPATHSDGNEQRAAGLSEDSGHGIGQETGHRQYEKINPFWILGISGVGLCLFGIHYVIKRRNEIGG